jgi:hypothetical protein
MARQAQAFILNERDLNALLKFLFFYRQTRRQLPNGRVLLFFQNHRRQRRYLNLFAFTAKYIKN